jgi:hypothetical protein
MKLEEMLTRMQLQQQIDVAVRHLLLDLSALLSDNRRQIHLQYKMYEYKSQEPVDEKDQRRLDKERIKILKKMVTDCLKEVVKQSLVDVDDWDPDPWAPIRMFDRLSNPEDYQCDPIDEKDIYAVDNAKYGFKRPLNEKNYYVRMEKELPLDEYLIEEEDDEVTQEAD